MTEPVIETFKGVKCWRKNVAIEKVGLYIPGGSAPLFSTVLMLGIPAKLAGCREIVICTPPGKDGKINPLILYTAQLIGITKYIKSAELRQLPQWHMEQKVYQKFIKFSDRVISMLQKPKELVQQDGIAIDMPAGPSEVLVIADETANPGIYCC